MTKQFSVDGMLFGVFLILFGLFVLLQVIPLEILPLAIAGALVLIGGYVWMVKHHPGLGLSMSAAGGGAAWWLVGRV